VAGKPRRESMNSTHETFRRDIDYERYPGSHWWSTKKWITKRECRFKTKLRPPTAVGNKYVQLTPEGILTLREAYVFDGVTRGFDTVKSMRAAAKHDGGCQLIEEGKLPWSFRLPVDDEFLSTLIEDQFWKWWAKVRYKVVRCWSKLKEETTRRFSK